MSKRSSSESSSRNLSQENPVSRPNAPLGGNRHNAVGDITNTNLAPSSPVRCSNKIGQSNILATESPQTSDTLASPPRSADDGFPSQSDQVLVSPDQSISTHDFCESSSTIPEYAESAESLYTEAQRFVQTVLGFVDDERTPKNFIKDEPRERRLAARLHWNLTIQVLKKCLNDYMGVGQINNQIVQSDSRLIKDNVDYTVAWVLGFRNDKEFLSWKESYAIYSRERDTSKKLTEVKEEGEARSTKNGERGKKKLGKKKAGAAMMYDKASMVITPQVTSIEKESVTPLTPSPLEKTDVETEGLKSPEETPEQPVNDSTQNKMMEEENNNQEKKEEDNNSETDETTNAEKLPEPVSSSGIPQFAATSSNVANIDDSYNEQRRGSSHLTTDLLSKVLAFQTTIMSELDSLKKKQEDYKNSILKEVKKVEEDIGKKVKETVLEEVALVVPALRNAVTSVFKESVSPAIAESFKSGVGDETVNQLVTSVNAKLEETIATQIQVQFQTSGKQALKETLRSSMETSMLPSFETSCRTMFAQIDSVFQKGMAEHTSTVQQRSEFAQSQLATNLKKELLRMISEGSYEDSFKLVLRIQDDSMISWLCAKVNLCSLLAMIPLPISQHVVLGLLSQLACDIGNDTSSKLDWMISLVAAINPSDPFIAAYGPTIFERVNSIQVNTESDNSTLTRLIQKLHSITVSPKQPSV